MKVYTFFKKHTELSYKLRFIYYQNAAPVMTRNKIFSVMLLLSIMSVQLFAQGRDPKDMVLREKQNLYSKISDLSEDQKMIIDGIYDEFAQSMSENMTEARKSGSWDGMRAKMEVLRTEKDGLMKDLLNEDQYTIYAKLTEDQRKRMEERRQQPAN